MVSIRCCIASWGIPSRGQFTSRQVTQILMTMRKMMIQVILVIFLSEMESDRISPRSRNTLQRSLRTCIRGLISRYSRTALYSGCSVGSESQKKLGVSSMFEAIPPRMSMRSDKRCMGTYKG